MSPSPPSSLPFTPWGPFWPDCPPPALKALPWPSLAWGCGVVTSSRGLPDCQCPQCGQALPTPSLIPGHSLHTSPCPALPRLPRVPLSRVSTGLDLLNLRRKRPVHAGSQAPLTPLCVHSSGWAEALPLQSSPALVLISSLFYMAFLSS